MSLIQKIFIGLFLVILSIIGFIALKNDEKQSTANQQEITSQKPISSKYLASTPHYGPLIQMQEIKVVFDDDFAVGTLSVDAAKNIAKNQKVILYDKDGYVLPLGGKVIEIQNNEETRKITIQLPQDTNTPLLFNNLDIITLETIASKRLPRSAYIKEYDEDGNESIYVWRATLDKNNNTYTLEKLYIDLGLTVLDYFEESGYKIHSYDLIILNPDSKIEENTPYNLKVTKLNLPLHNPIKQAWVDFEINRLNKQQADLNERAENCGNKKASLNDNSTPATGAASTPDGESCSTNFEGTDPFAIFNSLINKIPKD